MVSWGEGFREEVVVGCCKGSGDGGMFSALEISGDSCCCCC